MRNLYRLLMINCILKEFVRIMKIVYEKLFKQEFRKIKSILDSEDETDKTFEPFINLKKSEKISIFFWKLIKNWKFEEFLYGENSFWENKSHKIFVSEYFKSQNISFCSFYNFVIDLILCSPQITKELSQSFCLYLKNELFLFPLDKSKNKTTNKNFFYFSDILENTFEKDLKYFLEELFHNEGINFITILSNNEISLLQNLLNNPETVILIRTI